MLEKIRDRLGKIETLIRERTETLRPLLSEATQPVLSCGACTLPAYVLEDGEPGGCQYCFYHPDGEEAADAYVTFVLRRIASAATTSHQPPPFWVSMDFHAGIAP